ncbi:MAG: PPOX class F420-dependent oxidoreductase [Dehalococcoidia bacterium]
MTNELLDERQLRFVAKARIATLATVRAEGSPHITPVWYRYEDGDFVVSVDRGSVKHRNVARDPRVELCIDDRERPPFHTVIVRGRASVEGTPSAAWRRALAVHYLGEERGRRYIEMSDAPDSVLLRIKPEKIVGW